MPRQTWIVGSLVVSALCIGLPLNAMARGGGGGGHGGGGGGGHLGGGHGMGAPGAHFAGGHYGYGGHGHPGYRTFGGYYGGYRGYGWGYPYYGLGGLGLGLGLGYGIGYGLGYGSGGYGNSNYGYYSYSPYYTAVPTTTVVVPAGNTYVAPSGSLTGAAPNPPTTYSGSSTTTSPNFNSAPQSSDLPPAPAPVPISDPESAAEFARKAAFAFHARNYSKAVYEWRHSVIDDPNNPKLLLFLSQALFSTGQFEEAAGAAQSGMRTLPREEWGCVVANYHELYGNPADYTAQLRSLESAIHDKPKSPALRFLAGYHYSYLGFRKEAIDQFDRVLKESPRDEIASELRKSTLDSLARSATVAAKPQALSKN